MISALNLHDEPEDQDDLTIAALLNLSNEDIQKIMMEEFGPKIRETKGFDNLMDTFIH